MEKSRSADRFDLLFALPLVMQARVAINQREVTKDPGTAAQLAATEEKPEVHERGEKCATISGAANRILPERWLCSRVLHGQQLAERINIKRAPRWCRQPAFRESGQSSNICLRPVEPLGYQFEIQNPQGRFLKISSHGGMRSGAGSSRRSSRSLFCSPD